MRAHCRERVGAIVMRPALSAGGDGFVAAGRRTCRKRLMPRRIQHTRSACLSALIGEGVSFPRKTDPSDATSAASSSDSPAFWLPFRQGGHATQPPRRLAPYRTCAAPLSQSAREAPSTRPSAPSPHSPPPVHGSRRHEVGVCRGPRSTGPPAAQAAHAQAIVPPESPDRPRRVASCRSGASFRSARRCETHVLLFRR